MKGNVKRIALIATLVVVVLVVGIFALQGKSKNEVNNDARESPVVTSTSGETLASTSNAGKKIEAMALSESEMETQSAPWGTESEVANSLGEEEKVRKMLALQERALKMSRGGTNYEETDKLLADLIELNGGNELNGVDLGAARGFIKRVHHLELLMQGIETEIQKTNYDSAKIERLQKEIQELQTALTNDAREMQHKYEALGKPQVADSPLTLKDNPAKPDDAKPQASPRPGNLSRQPGKSSQ